ncbi:MAG: DUF4831 family protein [Bacteroidales bacterium]|nr:DUF4831 family protein [Bacteroidales bacterium]
MLIIPLFSQGQIRVNKIEQGFNAGSRDGIIYALPRTIIRVDVTLVQKELLAGPLKDYAEKYLGIRDYIQGDGIEYSLRSASLVTVSEADPEQFYFVTEGEKTTKTAWQTLIQLNGHGMITAIGAAEEDKENIAGALAERLSSDEVREIFNKYADLNLYARVDTIVRTINIDTITIEDYTFKTTMTDKPLDVKAREVADMIHRVRDDRYNLLTGYQEVNYSVEALEFMSDELLKLEKEYLRLFTGAIVENEITYSYTFLPTPESNGINVPIFNFSASNGIAEGEGNGTQAYIRVDIHGSTAAIAGNKAKEGGGLVYRIPEEAMVRLIYKGNTVSQIKTAISQYGKVASLPAGAGNVEFDGETGGLKSVKLKAE